MRARVDYRCVSGAPCEPGRGMSASCPWPQTEGTYQIRHLLAAGTSGFLHHAAHRLERHVARKLLYSLRPISGLPKASKDWRSNVAVREFSSLRVRATIVSCHTRSLRTD